MTVAVPRPGMLSGGAGATPGVLMFIGGLALAYWALSGWGLFGLGDKVSGKRVFGPMGQFVPKVLPGGLEPTRRAGGAGGQKLT